MQPPRLGSSLLRISRLSLSIESSPSVRPAAVAAEQVHSSVSATVPQNFAPSLGSSCTTGTGQMRRERKDLYLVLHLTFFFFCLLVMCSGGRFFLVIPGMLGGFCWWLRRVGLLEEPALGSWGEKLVHTAVVHDMREIDLLNCRLHVRGRHHAHRKQQDCSTKRPHHCRFCDSGTISCRLNRSFKSDYL